MAQEVPWYKQAFGSYPYSADVLDILRAIPGGILGGCVGATFKEPENAALAGAVVGGASNALVRAQIAVEYKAYQLAAPGQPIYSETPGFTEHQLFVGLLESLLGAGTGALIGYVAARWMK